MRIWLIFIRLFLSKKRYLILSLPPYWIRKLIYNCTASLIESAIIQVNSNWSLLLHIFGTYRKIIFLSLIDLVLAGCLIKFRFRFGNKKCLSSLSIVTWVPIHIVSTWRIVPIKNEIKHILDAWLAGIWLRSCILQHLKVTYSSVEQTVWWLAILLII